jgi:hypothetical protein
MYRLFVFATIALFTFVCTSIAVDDPAATSGQTIYSEMDAFGDVLGTIPSVNPGPSNAWVGMTWANGELIECKNVYPSTVPSQFLRINPTTGAVIATVNLPFNGYVIGCTFDGANLWVVQWSPLNVVYRVSLTGALVSQFSPNVSPYSARSAAFDGTNLWIGCNQSSGNTKLVKFSTTGTNLQEWTSGSAVGWYMDAEWDALAPAGGNLVVVDNVGNELLRLNVGVSVSIAEMHASQAVSPDVAEGVAFDGDNLWHNGAYASLGVIWKLDDGFTGSAPDVSLSLTPLVSPIVIPAIGGNFSFFAFATNNGTSPVSVQLWTRMKYPDGTLSAPMMGPRTTNLAPGTTGWFRSQNVPSTAPPGDYLYIGYAGSYPGTIYDSAFFAFSKSTTGTQGNLVHDWSVVEEPLGPEWSVPDQFNVSRVSPNPFNPATTISFTLPESRSVSLNVFDVSGRQVAQLINGVCPAGTHQATFDGSNLASGLYVYQLRAGSFQTTGKMMLLK